ncbi:cell division protein FtsQ/DivIB [Clostridium botulinum]|uniref:Cell division protein DivIB n=2 Tax=Clostridium botulinum TaxID=1491 RepID=A0A6G4EGZ8_CLOBO|nr:FtsQ-type POTRA domain-containing protein [Clostridium botulinum]APH19052.1 cell division FtsQ family protein [Clostridium botulinum]AUM91142.1 cell division protein FtsQ [Clostridium botulinum]NFB13709.1 FtsQ-type POTRA domain-containing protein [Clostridium botulinum]NFH58518.1 FtsQ-type POTRA domain-containing protein [Clostridium botulinum]NFH62455.1 FtsQ-type POTRA domain-containing protein [Clostridium botulinum]
MSKDLISTDEYIKIKKKRKRIKKIVVLFIFLISILVTLCLKIPYFNIESIEIKGNVNIPKEVIKDSSTIKTGNNIFYTNKKDAIENISLNPYIEEVKITKKLPNKLEIYVKEREALFYNKVDKDFFIISKNGCVLEKRKEIKNMKLINLQGFEFNESKIGSVLKAKDERGVKILNDFGVLLKNNASDVIFTQLDLRNLLDIRIYSNGICVKIGTSDQIEKKLNTAINILKRDELKKAKKGYVDVSYEGNPVFYIEK